jgi:hypothetical protein
VKRRAVPTRALAAALAGAALVGCQAQQLDPNLVAATDVGRYGGARVAIEKKLPQDPSDRSYILERLRLLILTLADGQPGSAEEVANQTFRLLRTQGLNADRTAASVVLNEDVKIWKGEPFEQALGYTYIAIQKAEVGQWDNARAAAGASLFLLKSFGDNEHGQEMSNIEVARRAAEEDARKGEGAGDKYINKGYTPIKTNFVLGYLLNGLANKALGRTDEANDNFHEAAVIRSNLEPLAKELATGTYNTVFIVDFGRGPEKIATGPDGAFAKFIPRTPSDESPLTASVAAPGNGGGFAAKTTPQVQDINRMAASLMWNNLEDVRHAKSAIGSGLLVGGLATAAYGAGGGGGRHHSEAVALAGLGAAAAGLLLKGTAHADTRHAEFLPQRVYVVPVNITSPGSTVTLEVAGASGSRLVLPAIDPPSNTSGLQLRYVRMHPMGGEPWMGSGQVVYGNDYTQFRVEGDTLPYILGGRDCSTPSPQVLERYQAAGNLKNLTTVDLENLYREEGIALTVEDQGGRSRKHILEGGDSLVAPLAGTAGFARLFNQIHEPYKPKSKALEELQSQLRGEQH